MITIYRHHQHHHHRSNQAQHPPNFSPFRVILIICLNLSVFNVYKSFSGYFDVELDKVLENGEIMMPGDSSDQSSAFDQDDDERENDVKIFNGTTEEEEIEEDDDDEYLEEATDHQRLQNDSSLSYHLYGSNMKEYGNDRKDIHPAPLKFFILDPPNVASELLRNGMNSSSYYAQALNEESAEVWLHRGFVSMNYEQGHTQDPYEADIFLIAGYAHLHAYGVYSEPINASVYKSLIVDPSKPHLLLMPTWNPKTAHYAGIPSIVATLKSLDVNLWSVGFERNPDWQGLPPSRIVPIPYVVRLDSEQQQQTNIAKREDFVFYAGSPRIMAVKWGGCDRRTMLEPLKNETNMFVRVLNGRGARITQDEYNKFMLESEYCLIMCGDTPTSRSLTSAMISECIPIRVGSRLRGLCEPPCVNGWGWTVSGAEYPQLPYSNKIEWDQFPEVNEADFTENGKKTLNELFRNIDQDKKAKMRNMMKEFREGWIYGWGDPVRTADFGGAYRFILDSFAAALQQENTTLSMR